ncbi:ABC-type transport auxiliary lipoprotein family protein [Ottowia sp.]|uniref:ABC-type transport auxiliary lipoprotein family protein n=1 Tax=Ottowia sp. TaxID=1898956 RepID=UPI002BD96DAD|nr:ABC-type transport auxiliary lipoprotein family protein [Ottowia sp.]HRN75783.1 ABC-type transport auxiliary lipoprotein family protein [Ottowia sp.]HRQ04011.1 ABC-type transport auxiliary lipoprotein family protein [Ottowia sp.]
MTSISDRARAAGIRIAAAALMLALTGCALPLPDKPVRPQPYDLGPPLPVAADAAPDGPALALDRVESSAAIDGTAIIYRLAHSDGGQQPRPYAQARWTMSPPQLITQRLREAFSATRPVVEAGAGLAQIELRAELDEFAQIFSSPEASEGVVRLRVTAIAPTAKTSRLLGQRTFSVRQPAATADAVGGVTALRAATDEAVRQVVAWVNALPPPR